MILGAGIELFIIHILLYKHGHILQIFTFNSIGWFVMSQIVWQLRARCVVTTATKPKLAISKKYI